MNILCDYGGRALTIGQVTTPVEDLARAVAFQRDTLGPLFLFQVRQRHRPGTVTNAA